MTDNYTTLQRNTLDGLSETAGCLYLKLVDAFEGHRSRANERRAFLTACRYEDGCGEVIDYILRNNPVHDLDARTLTSLSQFCAERWRHNFIDAHRPTPSHAHLEEK